MFKKCFFSFLLLGLALGFAGWQPNKVSAATLLSLDALESGDLIRGENFSAVYYLGADGFRYVFPNDKTYFTWYEDFDDVKWLSDADLGTIQIGGNVTYRPGVKMIKINSDSKTYAVGVGGTLNWVTSETVAKGLYGDKWNTMIDDVPDGFFSNYQTNEDWAIYSADAFDINEVKSIAQTINDDKDLQEPTIITITENGYSDEEITVDAGSVIRWENEGTQKHTASADNLSWGSGTIQSGGNFSRYFENPGTYTYFDSYDTGNTGTIIVE